MPMSPYPKRVKRSERLRMVELTPRLRSGRHAVARCDARIGTQTALQCLEAMYYALACPIRDRPGSTPGLTAGLRQRAHLQC